jgi:hypothetical protein
VQVLACGETRVGGGPPDTLADEQGFLLRVPGAPASTARPSTRSDGNMRDVSGRENELGVGVFGARQKAG